MECRPNGERVVSGPTSDVDNEIKHCSFLCTWKHCKTREEDQGVKRNDFRLFLTLMHKIFVLVWGFSKADGSKSGKDFGAIDSSFGAVQSKVTSEIK